MNISFCANLIVDKDFAKKPPAKIDKENLLRVKDEYATFLEEDIIAKRLTEGDTVELSTKNERDGYYLYMKFQDKEGNEPFETFHGISRSSNSQFDLNSLKMFTYWFIAHKSGITKRPFSEGIHDYIKRGVDVYAKKYIEEHKKKD